MKTFNEYDSNATTRGKTADLEGVGNAEYQITKVRVMLPIFMAAGEIKIVRDTVYEGNT